MNKLTAIALSILAPMSCALADNTSSPPPFIIPPSASNSEKPETPAVVAPIAPVAPASSEKQARTVEPVAKKESAVKAVETSKAKTEEEMPTGKANLPAVNPLLVYQKEEKEKERARKKADAEKKASWERAAALIEKKAIAAGGKPVSVTDYNLIQFSKPIAKVIFPPKAPILGNPVYVGENKTVMVKLEPYAKSPIQTVVELSDGSIHQIMLVPQQGLSGQTIVIGGDTAPVLSTAGLGTNPNAKYVGILSSMLTGQMPADYEKTKLPSVLVYDRLVAYPELALVNQGDNSEIVQYTLKSKDGLASNLDPSQFYAPGVGATLLDNTTVSQGENATLYIVWINGAGASQ